ncbi:MAG: hypothetical protein ACKD6N_06695 [Candidatus Bathyarchaeota archaeon]
MIKCPRCNSENVNANKSWDVIPKSGRGKPIHVTVYQCKDCNHKFRRATKLEVETKTQPTENTTSQTSGLTSEQRPTFNLTMDEVIKLTIVKEIPIKHGDGEKELKDQVYDYIKTHNGLLNIKECSTRLNVDPGELTKVIKEMLDDGSVAKIEEPLSPIEEIKEFGEASEEKRVVVGEEKTTKHLSIFERIKRAFTGMS